MKTKTILASLVVFLAGFAVCVAADLNMGTWKLNEAKSKLGAGAKAGTFVEIKGSEVGSGAKIPHLSYIGDAEIGEGANIGAGTIFANYDGVAKHRTTVGRHAKTGSNNTFVAPVTIGDGAGTAGGTVVRRDVPPGALAVSSGPQRNLKGWAQSKRAGTPQAEAAEAAETAGGRDASHPGGSGVGQTGSGGGES